MKAYYLLAPLGVALLAGCADYPTVAYAPVYSQPATVAYISPTPAYPTYVAPQSYTYVAPPNTVVLGAGASWNLLDSDGDGYANSVDNYPYDSRFH